MGYQNELLVLITIAAILTALLLPAVGVASEHLGWPRWVVLAVVVGVPTGSIAWMFASAALSSPRQRFGIGRMHRRK